MLASVEEDFHLEWTKKRGAAQKDFRGISRPMLSQAMTGSVPVPA
jgi:hypothetical protein